MISSAARSASRSFPSRTRRAALCSRRKNRLHFLTQDFLRGLSIVGLARKYGMSSLNVEAMLRRAMR